MIIFSFKQLPERLKLLPLQVVGNHYIYNHYWYISYRVGCFHLILRFAKSFIQVGSLSSNLTSLFGIKFENICISVSLKIYTCLEQFYYEHSLPVNRLQHLLYCSPKPAAQMEVDFHD